MEPIMIFKGVALAQSLAAYLGLIETVDGNIKKLIHQSLNAAIINIQNASRASTRELQLQYIREARNKFSEACAVEENENKISSYVGLAMCQYLDGDLANARISLANAQQVVLTTNEKVKAGAKGFGKEFLKGFIPGYNIWKMLTLPYNPKFDTIEEYQKRLKQFEDYKQKVTTLEIK